MPSSNRKGNPLPPENSTNTYVETLLQKSGTREKKALEAIHEDRVKQYRDFTVVVGYNDEYIVEDSYPPI